jgi:hypothetical protein
MTNFSTLLSAYGFKEETQNYVIRLLELAGCFDQERLANDLKSLGCVDDEISLAQHLVHDATSVNGETSLDLKKILLNFHTFSVSGEWPEKLHNWFIKVTQQDFFARKQGQERWQQTTGAWMLRHLKEITTIIAKLGLINEVAPKFKNYSVAGVFGSTYPNMVKRLEYLRDLVNNRGIKIDKIYLLSGERPADKAVDGGEEFLETLAQQLNIQLSEVIEAHLIQKAYDQIKGEGEFSKIPVQLIYALRGSKPRINTVDTLNSLAIAMDGENTGEKDTDKRILFVSRAPNIRAQEEDVSSVFAKRFPNTEVVGGACDSNIAINQVMGALGGTLFGGYVRVACQLGSQQPDEVLKTVLQTLSFSAPKPVVAVAESRVGRKSTI